MVRPCLRQFSDLPSWMDSAEAEALLRDRRVLMYCTGGVRCERASAYLRSKGQGFQDVLQLQGGIQRYVLWFLPDAVAWCSVNQAAPLSEPTSPSATHISKPELQMCPRFVRYLDEFPDGGHFRGKNFVFDERVCSSNSIHIACHFLPSNPASLMTVSLMFGQVAVGPPCGVVVGQCLRCHVAWDDYGARHRCATCRMLVLLCPTCASTGEGEGTDPTPLCCEVCSERRQQAGPGRGKRRGRKAGGQRGGRHAEDKAGRDAGQRRGVSGGQEPKARRRRDDAEAALDGLQSLIGALEEGS